MYLHAPQHFQEEEVLALTQILLLFLIGIWNSREGVLPRLRFLRLHLQILRLHLQILRLHLQFPLQVVCSWLHHQEVQKFLLQIRSDDVLFCDIRSNIYLRRIDPMNG